MSVPLIFFMVSNHFPRLSTAATWLGIYALVFVAVGWGITKFCTTSPHGRARELLMQSVNLISDGATPTTSPTCSMR